MVTAAGYSCSEHGNGFSSAIEVESFTTCQPALSLAFCAAVGRLDTGRRFSLNELG